MLLLSVLWWVLVEGTVGDPVLSGLAVVVSALASYPLVPMGSRRWRFRGLLRFLPFFVQQSIQGGLDVAWRALHPRLPVLPGFVEYPLRLPDGPARAFFVTALSLLPGTLSADLRNDVLHVHLLHREMPARKRIEQLELRVATMFEVDL